MDHRRCIDRLRNNGIRLTDLIGVIVCNCVCPYNVKVVFLIGNYLIIRYLDIGGGHETAKVYILRIRLVGNAGHCIRFEYAVRIQRIFPVIEIIRRIGNCRYLGIQHLRNIQIFQTLSVFSPEQVGIAAVAYELRCADLYLGCIFSCFKFLCFAVEGFFFIRYVTGHTDRNIRAVRSKVIELYVQLAILGGVQIEVLIHRKCVSRKTVIALGYRQIVDRRICIFSAIIDYRRR